jgi:uncharacterized protein (TIRG00374 family)
VRSAPPPAGVEAARRATVGGRLGRRVLLVVLLGVVVYGALVVWRDASSIAERLRTFAWWTFAAACGLSLANYGLRFAKWEYYLRVLGVRGIPRGESLLIFLSGFVLTVTPGKVGEVFKSVVLQDRWGVPVARTAPIVVAERLTDLLGVVALIAAGSASFEGGAVWATAGFLVVASIVVFASAERLWRAVVARLPRLPGPAGRLGARLAPRVVAALESLQDLVAPRHLVLPTLLSVVGWALEGVGTWILLTGFGQDASLPRAAFCYATATLAGALVPVPGGLGVTEKVLEELMVSVAQVPGAVATPTMILGRLATLWFAVLVGFVAFGWLGRRPPRPEESSPEPPGMQDKSAQPDGKTLQDPT